jgi:hypothetical protein
MVKTPTRLRFFAFPYSQEVFGSVITGIHEEPGPRRSTEIHVDLRGLRPHGRPELRDEDGQPWEVVRGEVVPLRLRFTRAAWASRTGFFSAIEDLPDDHFARRLFDVVHMRMPGQPPRYWLFADINTPGHELSLHAASCDLEELPGSSGVVELKRRWTWRPPSPNRPVSSASTLHRRYGGDPIPIRLGNRLYRQRLFIGGLRHQSEVRPLVDGVLNLCHVPNPWVSTYGMHPEDRFATKGELQDGMTAEELLAEAAWVVDRLRAGQRVLVHCHAGINRSSTVCCAALMLLEGITADAALARVRERHPEAAPDPYHWLVLRWLARRLASGPESALRASAPGQPLRVSAAIG